MDDDWLDSDDEEYMGDEGDLEPTSNEMDPLDIAQEEPELEETLETIHTAAAGTDSLTSITIGSLTYITSGSFTSITSGNINTTSNIISTATQTL
jgi:hypothetical protein